MPLTAERRTLVAVLVADAHDRCAHRLEPDPNLPPEACEIIELANAVLEAEHEIMARRWAALEALLPLIPPGGDESEVVYLPGPVALRAVVLAQLCGWAW